MGKRYLILLKHPEVYSQPITINADNFEWDSDDKTVSFLDEEDIRIAIFNMEELIGIVRVQDEETHDTNMHYLPTELEG